MNFIELLITLTITCLFMFMVSVTFVVSDVELLIVGLIIYSFFNNILHKYDIIERLEEE